MFNRRHLLGAALAGVSVPGRVLAQSPVVAARPMPKGELIYANPLRKATDVAGFRLEGEALIDFDTGQMRLKNKMSAEAGQASNFVYWCPELLPDDIEISWNFTAEAEPGLCILFFAAQGLLDGKEVSVLDPRLKPRAGIYEQYTQSDVSALQIAYFRRRWDTERAFHLCNLRHAPGFELLAQGADPLPDIADAKPPYRITVRKSVTGVAFLIDNLHVLSWASEKPQSGPLPTVGRIGFRQMAPLVALYSDLEVRRLPKL